MDFYLCIWFLTNLVIIKFFNIYFLLTVWSWLFILCFLYLFYNLLIYTKLKRRWYPWRFWFFNAFLINPFFHFYLNKWFHSFEWTFSLCHGWNIKLRIFIFTWCFTYVKIWIICMLLHHYFHFLIIYFVIFFNNTISLIYNRLLIFLFKMKLFLFHYTNN